MQQLSDTYTWQRVICYVRDRKKFLPWQFREGGEASNEATCKGAFEIGLKQWGGFGPLEIRGKEMPSRRNRVHLKGSYPLLKKTYN